jgi:hypothetical protein
MIHVDTSGTTNTHNGEFVNRLDRSSYVVPYSVWISKLETQTDKGVRSGVKKCLKCIWLFLVTSNDKSPYCGAFSCVDFEQKP